MDSTGQSRMLGGVSWWLALGVLLLAAGCKPETNGTSIIAARLVDAGEEGGLWGAGR